MLKRKIASKILLPSMMALLFIFLTFTSAFAYAGYVPITDQKYEVESNDTETTANIIPFNGQYTIVKAAYSHYGDEDYFIFACGEDRHMILRFYPLTGNTPISKTAPFYIMIEDRLTGEMIHANGMKQVGKTETIEFSGKAGHTYSIFIGKEGVAGEHIGARYSIGIWGR